ncbi:MAG: Ig-like domain-containing protein [Vulcanimicrobiota bacterium]
MRYLLMALLVGLGLGLGGCGSSQNYVFTQTQPPGPPAPLPVARDDSVRALGNAILNQVAANGVLANDTLNGSTITAFDTTTTAGGSVQLEDDGSFIYTPSFDFQGEDSFTYTLGNAAGQSTATVTLSIENKGWFVDNSVPDGGIGSQADPFNELDDALGKATEGDTIFVFRGTGTAGNAPFTLPRGVNLVGQGVGLVVAQTILPEGEPGVINGPVTLEGSNTVSGLIIENPTGGDSLILSGSDNANIHNNTFRNGQQAYLAFTDAGGELTIVDNVFEGGISRYGLLLQNTDRNSQLTISGNSFLGRVGATPEDAVFLDLRGSSSTIVTFHGNTVQNDTGGLIKKALVIEARGTAATTLSAVGNTLTGLTEDVFGIELFAHTTLSATISENEFIEGESNAIEVKVEGDTTSAVLQVDNNIMTDCWRGLDVSCTSSNSVARLSVLLTNNQIIGSGPSARFWLSSPSSPCIEIEGNRLGGDVEFDDGSDNKGLTVKRFSELELINDFVSGGPVEENPGSDVQEVLEGCASEL